MWVGAAHPELALTPKAYMLFSLPGRVKKGCPHTPTFCLPSLPGRVKKGASKRRQAISTDEEEEEEEEEDGGSDYEHEGGGLPLSSVPRVRTSGASEAVQLASGRSVPLPGGRKGRSGGTGGGGRSKGGGGHGRHRAVSDSEDAGQHQYDAMLGGTLPSLDHGEGEHNTGKTNTMPPCAAIQKDGAVSELYRIMHECV